jgi:two-component system, OmpR family, response regulator
MRCLIIEDDRDIAKLIETGLTQAGHTVVVCLDASSGLDKALYEDWDVLILDRMLPGDTDGLELLEKIKARKTGFPVIILSALSSLDEKIKGLRAGGDDYLAKPFSFDELLARIEAITRRSQAFQTTELKVDDLILDLRSRKVFRGGNLILLQPREFRLLEYLARNEGKVVTRKMLLENVWEYHFDPQTNVIDVHISRLRSKIDKDTDFPLIHTVRGAGFVLKKHS